jgi:hypothetical protein
MPALKTAGSFRDPSGFVFERGGALLRQVNRSYRDQYDRLVGSGLYQSLADDGLLIPHAEGRDEPLDPAAAYKVLRPEPVPFVSYPYEWCFGQLRDAALLTLAVQRRALEFDMALKDASAYNVQFRSGRPVLIDTLSFEPYRDGEPWVAYRQFCQHFLAPLALMSLVDVRLGQLLRTNIDGVPLDLAARLLPWRSRLRPGLVLHLHLHARFQTPSGDGPAPAPARAGKFGRSSLLGLLDSLEAAVSGLRWEPPESTWSGYDSAPPYTEAAAAHKERLVAEYIARSAPGVVWDLGANTGHYSRLASARGIPTLSFDADPSCVEQNYREARRRGESAILPLLLDLLNPSPASGWRNTERMSLLDRGPTDLVLALALVHHLAITGNLPLEQVASFLARAGRRLVVEFVPPEDPQARLLHDARRGAHHPYDREAFEEGFQTHFTIDHSEPLTESGRILYLMHRREDG